MGVLQRCVGHLALAGLLAIGAIGCGDGNDDGGGSTIDDTVRLNQIQVIGSHNSYHIQPPEPRWSRLLELSDVFLAWEFTHEPLDEQFEVYNIRQIELDVWADPEGGLYADRSVLISYGLDPGTIAPELYEPGFKVLHVQDVDFETNCVTFVACLQTVKSWSDANPHHLPIMILVEAKDDKIGGRFTVPITIGTEEFDALDAEIRSVFPPSQMITPDDVRRGMDSLEEAVLTDGWPTLREARGKVFFALDNEGKRNAYLGGRANLEGRVLFTNATPGDPDAAFVKENDPLADANRIPDLVREGYIVRTRADADTVQARSGDTTQRDAALASGAQFVSTDYYHEDPNLGTGYEVHLPGNVLARCNPINAPPECDTAELTPP